MDLTQTQIETLKLEMTLEYLAAAQILERGVTPVGTSDKQWLYQLQDLSDFPVVLAVCLSKIKSGQWLDDSSLSKIKYLLEE